MGGAAPVILLPAAPAAATVAGAVRRDLGPALAAYLPGRRWYGDKARPLAAVAIVDAAVDGDGPPWFVLAVAEVAFGDGSPPARYLIPLATAPADAAEAVALLAAGEERLALVDAFAAPGFPARLLQRLAQSAHLAGAVGVFAWDAFPPLAGLVAQAAAAGARAIGTEYSNSSVRYGEVLFLKLIRRLRAGVNPDEEVGRFLTEQTGFRHLPAPLGAGTYRDLGGDGYPFALAQGFVGAAAAGWDFVLEGLGGDPSGGSLLPALGQLGQRTGELHAALAAPTSDPAFAREPTTATDVAVWEAEAVAKLHAMAEDLAGRAASLAPAARELAERVTQGLPDLERRAAGFRLLVGTPKTRVHGDYHLGQTLRTATDWVILDFEGEPARTLAERRAKTCPLKDVAGMLRSFGYARGAALRARGADTGDAAGRLAAWDAAARAAFLDGYRSTVIADGCLAWMADEGRFSAAVAAWELDKALYEVAYELGNRPDWLDLPLRALVEGGHEPPAGGR